MPWEVKKQGKGEEPFKVVKKGSGEIVASHETRAEAEAHVRALYANTDESKEGSNNVSRGQKTRQNRNQGPTKPPPGRGGGPPGGGARGGPGRSGGPPGGPISGKKPPPGANKRTPVSGARRRLQR